MIKNLLILSLALWHCLLKAATETSGKDNYNAAKGNLP
jgi:hypothetical protein